MLYSSTILLKDDMNKLAALGQPFFFVINYEQTEGYIVSDPLYQDEIFFKFLEAGRKPFSFSPTDTYFNIIPNNFETYKKRFDKLQTYLMQQKIFLANLTERTEIETELSLENIFALSESRYQIYIPGRFVCFSPERFVKIASGIISTNPMKGTIDAGIANAEQILLEDEKEINEHKATVALMSKELGAISKNVHVSRFRYIDRLNTNRKDLLQVSSEIAGELPADYRQHIGDIIFSLLPGGSITGTPKHEVLEILGEIEGVERGYYCGVAGYFDGEDLDSAVLIRFVEQDGNKFYFRSGGGITIDSVCKKEYQEVLNKVYLPFV